MSTSPGETDSHERVQQKLRTRQALLYAARTLVEGGRTPTVAEVADAATISRATAYRYFPSRDALLAESAASGGLGDPEQVSPDRVFGRRGAPSDVEDRIALVSDTMYDFIRRNEPQFRRFLPTQILRGLEQSPDRGPQRPAFRAALIDRALEPIADQVPAHRLQRLKHALGVLIGTEALIATRDVLRLDHEVARAELAWACRALVRAALDEPVEPTPPAKRTRRNRPTPSKR